MFKILKKDREGIFLPPVRIEEHPLKGYICIATEDIPAFSLIERCPTVKFASEVLIDLFRLRGNRIILHDYNYIRGGNGKAFSYFAMGYGGVYSHSDDPNAEWDINEATDGGRDTILIRAKKDIAEGEEVTIRYTPKINGRLWFENVE